MVLLSLTPSNWARPIEGSAVFLKTVEISPRNPRSRCPFFFGRKQSAFETWRDVVVSDMGIEEAG